MKAAAPFYPYFDIPDDVWETMRAVGAEQQARTAVARHRRIWRDNSNFVGLCGEWCYAALIGQTWTPGGFYDGGTDFPGVDVKTSTSETHRYLLGNRQGTETLTAPLYFLVTVDLERRLAHPRGYATRAQLAAASEINTGYGRRQGVAIADLLSADALLAQILRARHQRATEAR